LKEGLFQFNNDIISKFKFIKNKSDENSLYFLNLLINEEWFDSELSDEIRIAYLRYYIKEYEYKRNEYEEKKPYKNNLLLKYNLYFIFKKVFRPSKSIDVTYDIMTFEKYEEKIKQYEKEYGSLSPISMFNLLIKDKEEWFDLNLNEDVRVSYLKLYLVKNFKRDKIIEDKNKNSLPLINFFDLFNGKVFTIRSSDGIKIALNFYLKKSEEKINQYEDKIDEYEGEYEEKINEYEEEIEEYEEEEEKEEEKEEEIKIYEEKIKQFNIREDKKDEEKKKKKKKKK